MSISVLARNASMAAMMMKSPTKEIFYDTLQQLAISELPAVRFAAITTMLYLTNHKLTTLDPLDPHLPPVSDPLLPDHLIPRLFRKQMVDDSYWDLLTPCCRTERRENFTEVLNLSHFLIVLFSCMCFLMKQPSYLFQTCHNLL